MYHLSFNFLLKFTKLMVSSSVRRHSLLESSSERDSDGGHDETRVNHQSGAWSSQDELFATSCMHRTVHFCFASAVISVMLTMISLVLVKDVAIEKEEGEPIATPAVATTLLITHHIINHSSSSSSSCCKVPCYCIVVLIRVSVSIHRFCCNKRTIIITHLQCGIWQLLQ